MLVASLEIYHSRPVAPTRRVALGEANLPVEPPPGYGGVLLGGIVANYVGAIDPDLLGDLQQLTTQLEHGRRIPQPRLRYRFQRDRIGLQCSRLRLVAAGEELHFDFHEVHADPAQLVLGAVYAAGQVPAGRARRVVMAAVRQGIGWQGPLGHDLIAALSGAGKGAGLPAGALGNPVGWALEILGFPAPASNGDGRTHRPSRSEIQRRYRRLLMQAHPDHGGTSDGAAERITSLSEARRILLG